VALADVVEPVVQKKSPRQVVLSGRVVGSCAFGEANMSSIAILGCAGLVAAVDRWPGWPVGSLNQHR